jgi:hypothetical protein
MNSFNQSNFNEIDNNYNNQISLNKSEKFQDAVDKMRLMIWNRFLAGVASNPNMTKKEVCHHLGLKVGTINSIQQYYKLQSPFYYKKPQKHRKKGSATNNGTMVNSKEESESDNSIIVKSKAKNKKGGSTYNFEETFNKTIECLRS